MEIKLATRCSVLVLTKAQILCQAAKIFFKVQQVTLYHIQIHIILCNLVQSVDNKTVFENGTTVLNWALYRSINNFVKLLQKKYPGVAGDNQWQPSRLKFVRRTKKIFFSLAIILFELSYFCPKLCWGCLLEATLCLIRNELQRLNDQEMRWRESPSWMEI